MEQKENNVQTYPAVVDLAQVRKAGVINVKRLALAQLAGSDLAQARLTLPRTGRYRRPAFCARALNDFRSKT
jgi:hypothetical protein